MDDIDHLVARLRDLPLDPRLDGIDGPVFAGIAARAQAHLSTSAMAVVAALSLGIGVAGVLSPAQPVHAATVVPLGAPAALAPSTLLGGR
jgi:hypothetical protein